MSEQHSEPESAPQEDAGEEFQPITSQEELNKRIGERIAGVKKKYADYDELRSKATEFDKLQEASKSETQKRDERISALEKELLNERRKTFAATERVPVSAVTGDTPEEWKANVEELLAWRAAEEQPPEKPTKTTSSVTLKSGATGQDSRMDPKERAAAALRGMRRQ